MPNGIVLNATTGVISGTPTEVFNSTEFTIWANNSAFSAPFNLSISSSRLDTDGVGVGPTIVVVVAVRDVWVAIAICVEERG